MTRIERGLIFSTSGSYAALGRNARAGALAAIADLRTAGAADIAAIERDPGGDPGAYERAASDLMDRGVRQVVGAITSWSRKDMIPVLARRGGLLWYPRPYEGFEGSDHVVYLGASPNHHVVPLADWIAAPGRGSAYLVGSNYVWRWRPCDSRASGWRAPASRWWASAACRSAPPRMPTSSTRSAQRAPRWWSTA